MFTANLDRAADVFADEEADVPTAAPDRADRLRVVEGGRTGAANLINGREWTAEEIALAVNWVAG